MKHIHSGAMQTVSNIKKLTFLLACCWFLCLGQAKADTFFSQTQGQSINQAQVMQAPQRGGAIVINNSRNNYNYDYDFNFNYHPSYWSNVDHIYNNYQSSFNSYDYGCPVTSSGWGYNYGYGLGHAASYVICNDDSFYDECFGYGNGYDHGTGYGEDCEDDYYHPGTVCKAVLIEGNYYIGKGPNCEINCPTKRCPSGYTGSIKGKFQNGTCTFTDLSTCTPVNNHPPICPVASAPNCGINGRIEMEEYALTVGGQTIKCTRPVCKVSTPEPKVCTQDAKQCPDGSFVSRDPNNNCQFRACPVPTGCTQTCPIGTAKAGQTVTGTLQNGQCIIAPGSCGGVPQPTSCSFTCPNGSGYPGQVVSGKVVNGKCVPVVPGACGSIPVGGFNTFRPTVVNSIFNNNSIAVSNSNFNQNRVSVNQR